VIDKQVYERALARAKAEGIRILGESALDGNRAWVVINPNHDGQYVVRLAAGAHDLTCSCPARVPCKHRALVTESLLLEVQQRSAWMRNGQRVTVGTLRMEREAALSQTRLWSYEPKQPGAKEPAVYRELSPGADEAD
jgi:hypothetical protein